MNGPNNTKTFSLWAIERVYPWWCLLENAMIKIPCVIRPFICENCAHSFPIISNEYTTTTRAIICIYIGLMCGHERHRD